MKPEDRNYCKSVREFQKRFATGEFEDESFDKQCEAGWYDWFCEDSSLRGKTKSLGNVVAKIEDGGKVDLDKHRVWFKNNCPCEGPLYDDIRIGDGSDNILVISRDDKRMPSKWTVYSCFSDYDVIAGFDDARALVKWLNEPWEKPLPEMMNDMKKAEARKMIEAAHTMRKIRGDADAAVDDLLKLAEALLDEIEGAEKEAGNA